ncbi:MAG: hypothetical protein JO179_19485, partial [Solirubrobacterales bacterium]|nr:hypothetical protein [Solirubrobacterales bacterium]
MMTVALACAGGGSALLASPAVAGGVDQNTGYLNAALYNVTPYTLTEVEEGAPAGCIVNSEPGKYCWSPYHPAATIPPGGSTGYIVAPNVALYPVIGNLFSTKFGYDAWITYRVDVLGGA